MKKATKKVTKEDKPFVSTNVKYGFSKMKVGDVAKIDPEDFRRATLHAMSIAAQKRDKVFTTNKFDFTIKRVG